MDFKSLKLIVNILKKKNCWYARNRLGAGTIDRLQESSAPTTTVFDAWMNTYTYLFIWKKEKGGKNQRKWRSQAKSHVRKKLATFKPVSPRTISFPKGKPALNSSFSSFFASIFVRCCVWDLWLVDSVFNPDVFWWWLKHPVPNQLPWVV